MPNTPRLRLVDTSVTVYQFHLLLHGVNPPVWRRIQMRSDHTLADLHFVVQIVMGWSNIHLHQFKIRGKGYSDGRSRLAGEKDTDRFRLGDFRFRLRERFLYEYDFTDGWRIQIRFEKALPLEAGRRYPVCVGGSSAAPPGDCGGAWAYMEMKDEHQLNYPHEDIRFVCDAVLQVLDAKGENAQEVIGDMETFQRAAERAKEYFEFRPWRFARRQTNKRLRYYAEGGERWKWQEWKEGNVKIKVQLLIESDEGEVRSFHEIARLERGELQPETLGLALSEAKSILAGVQERMVEAQVAGFVAQAGHCPVCGKPLSRNGAHAMAYRTPFGKLKLESPRFYVCRCQGAGRQSYSPVVERLKDRSSPELLYLETKWASLLSYGMTLDLLRDVLPIGRELRSVEAVRLNVHRAANRLESELGREQWMFVEGCPAQWQKMPEPPPPLTVGIDGGYVHSRDFTKRSENVFEVIVGKSIPTEGRPKCFGFVHKHDKKPKRRLYELLRSQGFQMNRSITFLSDGAETLRRLQQYLSLEGEHRLDWFHVTMRITVMNQMAKSLPTEKKELPNDNADPRPKDFILTRTEAEHLIKRIKWNLWHGNVYRVLELIEFLEMDLECMADHSAPAKKLYKWVHEFGIFIRRNRNFIPNYGDLWRNGERISTGFVESTVNQVIGKRFTKKQQMRWTKEGAHLLLQVRTKVLNEDWRSTFERWYPGLATENKVEQDLAA